MDLPSKTHHTLGIHLNQQVWSFFSKKDELTDVQKLKLEACAQGSLYHWSRSDKVKPVNIQRGHWLLSRTYAVLEQPEAALHHAERCFQLTREQELQGFDLAYAWEAMARAYAQNGHAEVSQAYQTALERGRALEGEKDRELFLADLADGPWFGFDPKR